MSPLPDIAHWWAIEAMIAPIASFELELLALDDDPARVVETIRNLELGERKYVLDVFHESPSIPNLKARYTALGYEFIRTGPILGRELPAPARGDISFVKKVGTPEQVEFANRTLSSEGENLSSETLADPCIQNFIAELDGQVVGWAQLVTVFPGIGYVNQLFTLPSHRGRRVGSALIERIHMQCDLLGLGQIVLISSEMALGLYRRLGYRPLAYFTAFRPKEG